jgi:hypothetical protein
MDMHVVVYQLSRKSLKLNKSTITSLSSSVSKPIVHLSVGHEETPTNQDFPNKSCRARILSFRDYYSGKIIAKWKDDHTM